MSTEAYAPSLPDNTWLANASVETTNYELIVLCTLIEIGMYMPSDLMYDSANELDAENSLINDVTGITNFYGQVMASATSDDTSVGGSNSSLTDQEISEFTTDVHNLFVSNPNNVDVDELGIEVNGEVYYPDVEVTGSYNSSQTITIEWTTTPPSGSANDLEVYMYTEAVYEYDAAFFSDSGDDLGAATITQDQFDSIFYGADSTADTYQSDQILNAIVDDVFEPMNVEIVYNSDGDSANFFYEAMNDYEWSGDAYFSNQIDQLADNYYNSAQDGTESNLSSMQSQANSAITVISNVTTTQTNMIQQMAQYIEQDDQVGQNSINYWYQETNNYVSNFKNA